MDCVDLLKNKDELLLFTCKNTIIFFVKIGRKSETSLVLPSNAYFTKYLAKLSAIC